LPKITLPEKNLNVRHCHFAFSGLIRKIAQILIKKQPVFMKESISFFLPILSYLFDTLVLTLKIIFGSLFPIIFACIILNFLSKLQNRLLYRIGGWNALMLTAWIGTPIHELSHYIAAIIANHKILELKLFKPNKRTGVIGYMSHTFREDSFYQTTFGNAITAIAPFFGGALAIYLLSNFLFPSFSLFSDAIPKINFFPIGHVGDPQMWSVTFKSHLDFFKYLFHTFFSGQMLHSWKLYVFLFIMFGIANHLSPSGTDFANFWTPLAMFLFAIFLLNLVLFKIVNDVNKIIVIISKYTYSFIPILYLAIFVSVIWLVIIFLVYSVLSIFKSR
jgi:hypothetical protein